MRFPPPIVAQTDPSKFADTSVEPLPLGLVAWDEGELTTIVTKVTYSYDPRRPDQVLTLCPTQPELVHEHAPAEQQGSLKSELASAADMVHAKIAADVLVVGHAYTDKASEKIDARVKVEDLMAREFCTVGIASDRLPLRGGYLRDIDGRAPAPPVGPCGPRLVEAPPIEIDENAPSYTDELEKKIAAGEVDPTKPIDEQAERPIDAAGDDVVISDEDVDLMWEDLLEQDNLFLERGVQHAAAASMSERFFTGAEVIEIEGLAPGGGARVLRLPGLVPEIVFETEDDVKMWPLMVCDTLLIDTDQNTVTLTFRGQVNVDAFAVPTNRVVMGLQLLGARGLLSHMYRDLQRGHFARAEVLGDVGDIALVDGRDIELDFARYHTFDRTPEPVLSLQAFAKVSAELSEADDRAVVLAKHKLNDEDWMLEERGWMDRIGNALSRGDFSVPAAFNEALAAARDSLQGER